jgi:hypothetical protein
MEGQPAPGWDVCETRSLCWEGTSNFITLNLACPPGKVIHERFFPHTKKESISSLSVIVLKYAMKGRKAICRLRERSLAEVLYPRPPVVLAAETVSISRNVQGNVMVNVAIFRIHFLRALPIELIPATVENARR